MEMVTVLFILLASLVGGLGVVAIIKKIKERRNENN